MFLGCAYTSQGWGLQREGEIEDFSSGRNGYRIGHRVLYNRGNSYEIWLGLARPQRGLRLLLDTETLVSEAWLPSPLYVRPQATR